VSWALWITGPPASGKSVIASAAAAELRRLGEPVVVLELDALRKTLTPEPVYSEAERDIVYRTLVYLAHVLTTAGVPVILDATAHRRAWRDLARASIARFGEVQLTCPLELRSTREARRRGSNAPSGIYAAAERPGATVPGVNVPYEEALAPELLIDTARAEVATAAAQVVALGLALSRSVGPRETRPGEGWAIWITGLPGSGKTSLACTVAERLEMRGVRVTVLDLDDLRDFVLAGRPARPEEEEIVHRALVCAGRLLTEAGVPVVIDATAPRRVWRDLARAAIARFAEVQLRCPPAICGDRERAVRWNLVLCAPAPRRRAAAAPDIAVDYEYSLRPDLALDTAAQSLATAAEDVFRLAQRLHRDALTSRMREKGDPPC
jgi:adenylylsulfate kinase